MGPRSILKPLAVLFLLVTATYTENTLDEDRDALIRFYDMLSGLAHSLVDVDNDIKSRDTTSSEDVKNLTNSQARMDYEVKVMRVEHEAELLAGKRSEVTDERGEKITSAETDLRDTLEPAIKETETNLSLLNETMKTASLSGDKLNSLMEQVNSMNYTKDEQISVPQPSDVWSNVTREIETAESIFERRASADQRTFIDAQLKTVKDNFREMLADDSSQNFEELSASSKKIDAALLQIKQLDLLQSQARMEL